MNMGSPNAMKKTASMARESEMPIVLLILRTTQPQRREGALLLETF